MPDTRNLDIEAMRNSAGIATRALRSLTHEDRLLLLCLLSQEELCVSELEQRLDIRQPSLSQQLGVLRREDLVSTRRDGKHIYYRVADDRIMNLLQTLYDLYCRNSEGDKP
jgi:DNA-binding transcriptional ArsR family regulator